MTQSLIPQRIRDYLNLRGITDLVISKYNISWNGINIVIPVYNEGDKWIFNKYRRDPESELGPKYKYDPGTSTSLFNRFALEQPQESVYIVEGEFDALALISQGLVAVSSTGGAGSFDKNWDKLFKDVKDVYICYDADAPGINGAINVQSILPQAKVIWLPTGTPQKDVTEYLLTHGIESFKKLVEEAESHNIPQDPIDQPKTKKEHDKVIKEYEALSHTYLLKQRELKYQQKEWQFTEMIKEYLNKKADYYKTRRTQFDIYKEVSSYGTNEVIKAKKAYSIGSLIEFNRNGFARCLWHNDSSPSMKFYHVDNYVYCYGGCGHKDLIDVVMALDGIDFNQAIEKINGKSN